MEELDKRFQHLGPIAHPDKSGIYMDVLSKCIGNPKIHNLAIAGPYAAGKSSVINRYKEESVKKGWVAPAKMLTISLADYFDTKNSDGQSVAIEDLELRILQQILYTSSGRDLPYSRFSRIKTIKRSLLSPLVTIIWGFLSVIFATTPGLLTSFPYWSLSSVVVLLLVVVWLFLSVLGLEWLFHFFQSRTINKISLKNLEFERAKDDPNSVLSKYFDEILYFFESTDFEIVVFEDLDRFNTSQIFSKLRELNTLVNNNVGINRPIQFVYALKDSMFLTNERTKFFDFILPVVPVTGTANAEDTFIERNELLPEKTYLKRRYLQDIAQFVTEPRVIHNVFNEYVVYRSAINNPNLNAEKLFALMVYKTLFVHDYEKLLNGMGDLYGVLTQAEIFRSKVKQEYEEEIAELELRLKNALHEHLESEHFLVNLYIAELARKGFAKINSGGWTDIGSIESVAKLKQVVPYSLQHVNGANSNNQQINLSLSLKEIENKLHPGKTIEQKLEAVLDKSAEKKTPLLSRKKHLLNKLNRINQNRLSELFVQNENLLSEFDTKFIGASIDKNPPWQHIALVKYMLRHGYLDEQYYLYTTMFNNRPHYTEQDQNFYLHVQAQHAANFDAIIDNPDEITTRLSAIDFSSSSIFNVTLLSYFLQSGEQKHKLKIFLDALIDHYYGEGQKFIIHYLFQGKLLQQFAESIAKAWTDYVSTVFSENTMGTEARWLIGYLSPSIIANINDKELLLGALEQYPEAYITSDEDSPSQNAIHIIDEYSLDIPSLAKLDHVPRLMIKLIELARYAISSENIHFALSHSTSESIQEIKASTFSIIISSDSSALQERIWGGLENYINNVMFEEPANIHESERSIVSLVNADCITEKTREGIIAQQAHIFSDLHKIEHGHQYFLTQRKVRPSWELLEKYHNNDSVPYEIFIEYLDDKTAIESLLMETSSAAEHTSQSLRECLLNADELSTSNYSALNRELQHGKISSWPAVSEEKCQVLLEHKLVALNEETFTNVLENPLLLAMLIENETEIFLKIHSELPTMNASHIVHLIQRNINEVLSKFLASLMNNYGVSDFSLDVDRLTEIYLLNPDDSFKTDFAMELLSGCTNQKNIETLSERLIGSLGGEYFIETLTRDADSLNNRQIRLALEQFPSSPYSDLTLQRKKPGFEMNNLNLNFLDMLQKKRIIPLYSQEGNLYRVRRYRRW